MDAISRLFSLFPAQAAVSAYSSISPDWRLFVAILSIQALPGIARMESLSMRGRRTISPQPCACVALPFHLFCRSRLISRLLILAPHNWQVGVYAMERSETLDCWRSGPV